MPPTKESGKRPDSSDFFSAWVAYADALEVERDTYREALWQIANNAFDDPDGVAPDGAYEDWARSFARAALERPE